MKYRSGSKHALEAFSEALRKALQEFSVQVATINPGPYLTGFNDREYESWKRWPKRPEAPLFDYSQTAFPYVQLDPDDAIERSIKVLTGKTTNDRNAVPKSMEALAHKRRKEMWDLKGDEGLGTRNDMINTAYEMEPCTIPTKGIVKKIKDMVTQAHVKQVQIRRDPACPGLS